MKAKLQPPGNDPDWVRLLDAEHRLQAEIVAAQAEVRHRVEQARTAAARAAPDPEALARLAAEQQQADTARQRSELERLTQDADNTVRALTRAPESLIDTLARTALAAAWCDVTATGHR